MKHFYWFVVRPQHGDVPDRIIRRCVIREISVRSASQNPKSRARNAKHCDCLHYLARTKYGPERSTQISWPNNGWWWILCIHWNHASIYHKTFLSLSQDIWFKLNISCPLASALLCSLWMVLHAMGAIKGPFRPATRAWLIHLLCEMYLSSLSYFMLLLCPCKLYVDRHHWFARWVAWRPAGDVKTSSSRGQNGSSTMT